MTRFMNILASVALATALMPIAANATTVTLSSHLTRIHTVAAQCEAVAPHGLRGQTSVQSGWMNQLYPDSVGG